MNAGDWEGALASYRRALELRDGTLHYHRDGGREYRLAPMTADTFVLEGLPTFRIRFEPAGGGPPERIVGLYSDGRTDESPRD